MLHLSTFSIVARCHRTGMVGVAVATAVPAAAGLCIFIQSRVGAIATQSWINPYLGVDGLAMLAGGEAAESARERLISADPGREDRQLGIVSCAGGSTAYTGRRCVDWAGHLCGDGFAALGNMLVSSATIEAMAEAFEQDRSLDLAERLMRSLEAGQRAGGDKRGRQSAALKVMADQDYPYMDVRVDDHTEPVLELRRIFELSKQQLLPFVAGMPKRDDPLGFVPETVIQMLLKAPAERTPPG